VAEPDAREVLGFAPGAKLTRELVKARQRELAKLWHPDRGGSTAATQRLNVAAKKLLDSL
jgi:curved DNA-binding protein CbpA